MMTRKLVLFLSALFLSGFGHADEINHFPALDAPDVKTAYCNLQTYNAKLTAIVEKSSLEPIDMVKVHELTYTLENALARLQAELTQTAATLEEVHLASEDMGQETIKNKGREYIAAMQQFVSLSECK